MFSAARRRLLRQAAAACVASPALVGLSAKARSQQAATNRDGTRIFVDTRRTIAALDRNVLGSFLEHLGRTP